MLRRSADSPWLEQPRGVPGVRRGQASLLRGPRTPTRTSLGPTTPPSLHPGVRRARPPSAAPGARPSTRVRSPGAPLIGQHPHPAKPGPKPRFYVSPNRSREPREPQKTRFRVFQNRSLEPRAGRFSRPSTQGHAAAHRPRAHQGPGRTRTHRCSAQKPDSTFPGIDPFNPENHKNPVSAFPRIDPMNPEPSAFPNPGPRLVQRFHQSAHIREFMQCAVVAEAAPQARNFCRG